MNEPVQQFYELEGLVQASMNGVVCGVCDHALYEFITLKSLRNPNPEY